MAKPNAIAQIINQQWPYIDSNCNSYQKRIFHAIRSCRTPVLGGHLYLCDSCHRKHYRFNSCRNRYCSQCQNTQKEAWIEARQNQLINTPYFHLVFTFPHELNPLCLQFPRAIYALLFRVSWQTLNEFGWNHKYLGAQIGASMVLHTWGSNLSLHPHVHCIVPGGGIDLRNKWRNAKGNGKFLFPVIALSNVFRAKFLKGLEQLQLKMDGPTMALLKNKEWVVYAKPPFGGPDAVIKYLGRYTHKAAITHHRILKHDQHSVKFSFTDYRHRNQKKTMSLTASEFVRRLAMHFLPIRFCRIRHFGILSSQWKSKIFPTASKQPKIDWIQRWLEKGLDVFKCPHCKKGKLQYVAEIAPGRGPPIFIF